MKAFDQAKRDGHKNPAARVASLGLKGFFKSCIYRWKAPREKFNWPLVCESSPALAKSYKEVPNVIRSAMGKDLKFKFRFANDYEGTTSMIPSELQAVVADSVVSWKI